MNAGLTIFGVILLIGMFLVGNVLITPQQRNQAEIASEACGSGLGKIAGAISGSVAEECRKAQTVNTILSFEPFIYGGGGILFLLGLLIPSGKKEKIVIREVEKPTTTLEESEKEVKEKSIKHEKGVKSKIRFCGNCGAKVSKNVKFCSKCGEKL